MDFIGSTRGFRQCFDGFFCRVLKFLNRLSNIGDKWAERVYMPTSPKSFLIALGLLLFMSSLVGTTSVFADLPNFGFPNPDQLLLTRPLRRPTAATRGPSASCFIRVWGIAGQRSDINRYNQRIRDFHASQLGEQNYDAFSMWTTENAASLRDRTGVRDVGNWLQNNIHGKREIMATNGSSICQWMIDRRVTGSDWSDAQCSRRLRTCITSQANLRTMNFGACGAPFDLLEQVNSGVAIPGIQNQLTRTQVNAYIDATLKQEMLREIAEDYNHSYQEQISSGQSCDNNYVPSSACAVLTPEALENLGIASCGNAGAADPRAAAFGLPPGGMTARQNNVLSSCMDRVRNIAGERSDLSILQSNIPVALRNFNSYMGTGRTPKDRLYSMSAQQGVSAYRASQFMGRICPGNFSSCENQCSNRAWSASQVMACVSRIPQSSAERSSPNPDFLSYTGMSAAQEYVNERNQAEISRELQEDVVACYRANSNNPNQIASWVPENHARQRRNGLVLSDGSVLNPCTGDRACLVDSGSIGALSGIGVGGTDTDRLHEDVGNHARDVIRTNYIAQLVNTQTNCQQPPAVSELQRKISGDALIGGGNNGVSCVTSVIDPSSAAREASQLMSQICGAARGVQIGGCRGVNSQTLDGLREAAGVSTNEFASASSENEKIAESACMADRVEQMLQRERDALNSEFPIILGSATSSIDHRAFTACLVDARTSNPDVCLRRACEGGNNCCTTDERAALQAEAQRMISMRSLPTALNRVADSLGRNLQIVNAESREFEPLNLRSRARQLRSQSLEGCTSRLKEAIGVAQENLRRDIAGSAAGLCHGGHFNPQEAGAAIAGASPDLYTRMASLKRGNSLDSSLVCRAIESERASALLGQAGGILGSVTASILGGMLAGPGGAMAAGVAASEYFGMSHVNHTYGVAQVANGAMLSCAGVAREAERLGHLAEVQFGTAVAVSLLAGLMPVATEAHIPPGVFMTGTSARTAAMTEVMEGIGQGGAENILAHGGGHGASETLRHFGQDTMIHAGTEVSSHAALEVALPHANRALLATGAALIMPFSRAFAEAARNGPQNCSRFRGQH